MRIILVIAAALIAAGGTGYYLFSALNAPVPADTSVAVFESAPSKEVFVPAVQLAAGSILAPVHLGRMKIDEGAITPEMIIADEPGTKALTGSVARQVLAKGVPISRSAIVQPGDRGFLAAVLDKGMRAITIPINEVAGMSGLVLPGDRVDIILTYSVDGDIIEAERNIRASETLLSNLRVLALDNRLSGATSLMDSEGNVLAPPIARTATLEVSPQQAEMMTLATTLGDLSLVLNSVRDGGTEDEMDAEALASAGADSMVEPLRLAARPSRAGSGSSTGLRALTLDRDVTTLLQRQPAELETGFMLSPVASPVPPADRTSRVQIVRGTSSQDVNLGALIAADPGAVQPVTPQPAAE